MRLCDRCGQAPPYAPKAKYCEACRVETIREAMRRHDQKRGHRRYMKCSGCGIRFPEPQTSHRCSECNKAHLRERREANPEQFRAYDRARYAREVEGRPERPSRREQQKAYKAANRERFAAQQRARYRENPEYFVAKVNRRRARLAGVPSTVTPAQLRALVEVTSGHCQFCGTATHRHGQRGPQTRTFDHVVPFIRSGHDVIENIQLLCLSCNSRKNDIPMENLAWLDLDAAA